MQFGSGSAAGGSMFIFAMNGSPALLWLAIIMVILTLIFFVHRVIKLRIEKREAHEMRPLGSMET